MKEIASQHCFNHRRRMAAARCPECGRFFLQGVHYRAQWAGAVYDLPGSDRGTALDPTIMLENHGIRHPVDGRRMDRLGIFLLSGTGAVADSRFLS